MIAVLGRKGMLGSMVSKVFGEDCVPMDRTMLEAEKPDLDIIQHADWVINCIGKIKPYCDDVPAAIKVNALFPHLLPEGTIQIATDCVYSGKKGDYVETDPHDALDVYGKTKSLGEAPQARNLRCSIIGPETKNHISLLDWFLDQKEANGFTNHMWNGITTYHFSKIVQGVIRDKIELPYLQHIVPADVVSKHTLLSLIAVEFNHDIPILPVRAPVAVDRTLGTEDFKLNVRLWKAAGYDSPPTVQQMIAELAAL